MLVLVQARSRSPEQRQLDAGFVNARSQLTRRLSTEVDAALQPTASRESAAAARTALKTLIEQGASPKIEADAGAGASLGDGHEVAAGLPPLPTQPRKKAAEAEDADGAFRARMQAKEAAAEASLLGMLAGNVRVPLCVAQYYDLGVTPCGARLEIRKGEKGAVRLPKILVLIIFATQDGQLAGMGDDTRRQREQRKLLPEYGQEHPSL